MLFNNAPTWLSMSQRSPSSESETVPALPPGQGAFGVGFLKRQGSVAGGIELLEPRYPPRHGDADPGIAAFDQRVMHVSIHHGPIEAASTNHDLDDGISAESGRIRRTAGREFGLHKLHWVQVPSAIHPYPVVHIRGAADDEFLLNVSQFCQVLRTQVRLAAMKG